MVLFPIMFAVFIAFLVIGIAILFLAASCASRLGPDHFSGRAGHGAASSRHLSSPVCGQAEQSDTRGPKRAVVVGLLIAAAAGLFYVASLSFVGTPSISVAILLFGRALLGVGESFIITGAQSWGLAILGLQNTSKVLAWVGSAMFGAFAAGAPIGTLLYARWRLWWQSPHAHHASVYRTRRSSSIPRQAAPAQPPGWETVC